MSLLKYGSLREAVQAQTLESAAEGSADLPGVTLASYELKKTKDFLGKAEVYLFGVAADASGEIRTIPFGQADLDKREELRLIRKVGKGEEVEYMGSGLALVLPPVSGFLVLRLLIADNDSSAREAADVIKSVGELVATKEAIQLLILGGMPVAAATAFVLGKSLEVASKMMARNKDDVIETFEGYFTAVDMREDVTVDNKNAKAVFKFVSP